jgi:surfactin family lipopeptide synthetase A
VCYPETIPTPDDLIQIIQQYGVSILWLTSALFNTIIDYFPEGLSGVQQLLIGGEATSLAHVRRAMELLPSTQIINGYGPSECTVFSCCYPIPRSLDENLRSIPIGRPIGDRKVYLLDSYLNRVPIGVTGEICITGPSLARAYVNRPKLTAEKFINNPFIPGERLYKTGDLGRFLPDGNIEFIGRIDHLVKIRGFRIELGEIETVLTQHPQIQQVLAIALEDTRGDKYIAAYVTNDSENLTTKEIREFLKQRLPEYMLPSAYIILKAFPLTSNGKIDRRALKAPNLEELRQNTFVASRNPTEEIIARIIANVLGLEQIGIHDNFFELGGHSLLAIRVVSRISETFTTDIPLRRLFESPTVAELAQLITNLSPTDSTKLLPTIPSVSQDRYEFPLSFAQSRLWFLDQLEEQSATYNTAFVTRIAGSLDLQILETVIQEILKRHSVLRTNFKIVNGSPIQVINPIDANVLNVITVDSAISDSELQKLLNAQVRKRFNLAEDRLFQATVWQISEQSYLLGIAIHHIITDGWSIGILRQEISSLYTAFVNGKTSPLADLRIQYSDYAVWQREWLTGEILANQLQYWQQQLADAPPLLNLPTDRSRPAVQTFRGKTVSFVLDIQLTQQLEQLTHKSNTTLFMTLLAGFVTLLSRYSGSEDILVGCPIANRHHPETEQLIGFFVNTLVLRTKIQDNPSFWELLHQIRINTLEAYAHQDAPFEQVVDALQTERSLGHNPVFQVMFDLLYESTALTSATWELPDIQLTSITSANVTTKFDLSLELVKNANGIRGTWEYNCDLFEQATIERFSEHLQVLFAGIVHNPQENIRQLPLLSDREQQQLWQWRTSNPGNLPLPNLKSETIHQLFVQQAKKTPNHIAVEFCGQKLTYQELDIYSNQLAHYLQNLGVQSDVLVGVCIERGLNLIVALLGILKAGGAYVPLDPSSPANRLGLIVSDSQISILLTQEKLQSLFSSLENHNQIAHIINLDQDLPQIIAQFPKTQPNITAQGADLAYIIYTSGSTGTPKGVEIEHHSVVNFIKAASDRYQITHQDRVLQFASIAFDAAAEEIYPCLTRGGTLVLRTDEMLLSAQRFMERCHEWNVTVLDLPTSYWHQLIGELTQIKSSQINLMASLRLVIIGGETALLETCKLWQKYVDQLSNPPQLINTYGPTESTIVATSCNLSEYLQTKDISVVPIGKPLANVQTWVLDCDLQPVPMGVVGELHIGGSGLARGYLRKPEITAEKFVNHSFGQKFNQETNQEERLYKTGDLVRYLPDGNLEFCGRIDQQVKIRGFRIEIGEIIAVLIQHSDIQDAIVLINEDQGQKYLVAYLVPQEFNSLEESNLVSKVRLYLRQHLPEYMMPTVLVILEKLPLNTNGKVDRKALPAPCIVNNNTALVLPQTPVEKLIAEAWQRILKIAEVGLDDNFFDLGGNSLLLVQSREELKIVCNQELSIVQMFQNPTIRTLATCINGLSQDSQNSLELERQRPESRKAKENSVKQQRELRKQNRFNKRE